MRIGPICRADVQNQPGRLAEILHTYPAQSCAIQMAARAFVRNQPIIPF